MTVTVRQRMTADFVQLNPSSSLAEARMILDNHPGGLGVILDEESRPVTLVSVADLDHVDNSQELLIRDLYSKLPPGIVVAADALLEDFVNSPVITALDIGACGAMVFDNNQLVGILTNDVIDHFIVEEYKPIGMFRGLETLVGLAGDIVTKPLIFHCRQYNHRNELEYFDPDNPPDCKEKKPKRHLVR